ncbi:MAG: hypothetical protein M0P64_04025 [Candidatus Pacebacteria bacterium]|jgi:hypothetical protein|nr:hypothetical protein [Candidatus Paceibacterota bacterium]
MMNKKTKQRGSLLLIAILVSGVALAVGLGVYNRSYRELLFASFWSQTQTAFASTDAGLECALYWLLHPGAGGAGTAQCFGANIPVWDPLVQTGTFEVATPSGACVNIVIAWDTTLLATTTTARGYNDACGSVSPRRVERGLRVSL